MLSTTELDAMRATLEASLPDVCEIRRDERISDGAGGHALTASTIATVSCRLSPQTETVRNAELEAGQRLLAKAPWIITLPAGTDVTEADRIRSGGREWEVAAVLGARSWEVGLRVAARLVNAGAG